MIDSPLRKTSKVICALLAIAAICALAGAGCGSTSGKEAQVESVDKLLEKGIKPNEMGMVMLLEYHRIKDKESDYTRSIENFKKDLQTLYDKGYRLVSFHALATGKASVPAGTTPVVVTLDPSPARPFPDIKGR